MNRFHLCLTALFTLVFVTAASAQRDEGAELERQRRATALTERFENPASELEKKHAARTALQLARNEGAFVEGEQEMRLYLIAEANEVLAADEPYPLAIDASGYSLPDISQEFVAWASAQGLDPEVAGYEAIYQSPVEVGSLIGDTDPATVALFQDALDTQNYLVGMMAAWGLAAAGDTESIEMIGDVAATSPEEIALNLARILDRFGDPAADAEAASIRAEHQ